MRKIYLLGLPNLLSLLVLLIALPASATKSAKTIADEQTKDLPMILNKCSQIVSNTGFDKTLLIVTTMDFICLAQSANPNSKIEHTGEKANEYANAFLDYYKTHPGKSYCILIRSNEYDVDIINLRIKDRINSIELNINIDEKMCKESIY